MNFFQKVGNAFSRFMYGRNGADHLGMAALWLAILLDIVNIFVKNGTAHAAVASVAMVLTLWAVFRMFSRNLQRRRAENAWFLTKFVYPVQRRRSTGRQQRMDRTTNTSPVPTAARSAASRAERARSSSPAPSATAKSTDGAERPTRPAAEPRGAAT